MISPLHIAIPTPTISDLHDRLRATRWPGGVVDSGGVPLTDMRSVVRYWLEAYDWPRHEAELAALPNFEVEVSGQHLHFLHFTSTRADATPILLLHGWPGSFLEMLAMVPLLTEWFHVVVPSLPGYGFSAAPTAAGMSNERMASLLVELMSALGYQRFAVHGGDVGAGVATWMALRVPDRVTALHLNYIPGSYTPFVEGEPTAEEAGFLRTRAQWVEEQGAYGHVQRTRPLTLAYGLSDSPAALAAWMLEKFREWADPRSPLPLDIILTNITLYWATNTIASSMRVYLESAQTPLRFGRDERVRVPCGIARFPYEAPFPPRAWVERSYNVVRWSEASRGGHFAALEAPEDLANDITAFVTQTLSPSARA